jgi:hypothetical protein
MTSARADESQQPTEDGGMTPSIHPRWEWRIFEPFPGAFIARAGSPAVDEDESIETYILSAASPHNVKIRGGQLDVKVLQQTRAGDLELWRPVFKARFPVDAGSLEPVWDAWGLPLPALLRPSYTVDQFLNGIVALVPGLTALTISKRRAHFTLGGCRAERAVIEVAAGRWDTLAIEDEDPNNLLLAQRAFGRALPRGSSYPAMLKRIARASTTLTPSMRTLV